MKQDTVNAEADAGQGVVNLGWQVTFAGLGINLALGILYTWSVISKSIPADWGWSESAKSWPYSVACLVFCLVMVPAGRLQDKIGPRLVATIGGVLVGIGMIVASFTTAPIGYILGFGVLAGAGIGFGYASATPPAVKWFPAAKTGMVAGLVVSGFGLASVYAAPATKLMVTRLGLPWTMFIWGVAFFVLIVGIRPVWLILYNGLAAFLVTPPEGYRPVASEPARAPVSSLAGLKKEEFTPKEMLGTGQFYLLWFMYACGAGAGLMIIAKLAAIAKIQADINLGFLLVAVLAIGNGAGRIAAGVLSDKVGRTASMFGFFVFQAILVFLLSRATPGSFLASVPVLALISALIGANYGSNLALFPSITKDYYGLKNFGMNYGLVFTAWGVGGFMLALLAGKLYDMYESFNYAYYGAAALLVIAAVVTLLVKPPHVVHEAGE